MGGEVTGFVAIHGVLGRYLYSESLISRSLMGCTSRAKKEIRKRSDYSEGPLTTKTSCINFTLWLQRQWVYNNTANPFACERGSETGVVF